MIRLLHETGCEAEDLIEIQAPEGATTRQTYVTAEWARRWPSEEIWKARKVAGSDESAKVAESETRSSR